MSRRVVSCGCAKADSALRRAARCKVPPAERRAIARSGGKARAAKRPAYRMTLAQAARGLGVSEDAVRRMIADGRIAAAGEGPALRVCRRDVESLADGAEGLPRPKKTC